MLSAVVRSVKCATAGNENARKVNQIFVNVQRKKCKMS